MFLKVHDRQFGFKKDLGCNGAIFVLCNVTEYLMTGSNIHLASVDA